MHLDGILEFAVKRGISDIHLKEGRPPAFRLDGQLKAQQGGMPVGHTQMLEFMDQVLVDDGKRQILADSGSVDSGYSIHGVARFRVNIYRQYNGMSMAFRVIPTRVKSIRELALPLVLEDVANEHRGLLLVTGTTGSGKSTTLAAVLDHINRNRAAHVVTIEDPVEFLLEEKSCVINQREVGSSTTSFASALRAALRQDPDVILLGELRDRETIEIALQAAETGHLVLSTMHTIDAAETINRAVSVFPPFDQPNIRKLFASVIRWIVSQRLLPRKDGRGRIVACEVLRHTPRTEELIVQEAGPRAIAELLEKGTRVYGTQSFDQCLMNLYQDGLITSEEALKNCSNPSDFKLRIAGIVKD